jgi:hypothetical protein
MKLRRCANITGADIKVKSARAWVWMDIGNKFLHAGQAGGSCFRKIPGHSRTYRTKHAVRCKSTEAIVGSTKEVSAA